MTRRLLIAGAVVLLVGGAGLALTVFQQRRAEEAGVERLLSAAEAVLQREEPDRAGAQAVVRDLRAHPLGSSDPRLIRARARLELALGRLQAAWDVHAPLALALEPAPEDMLLAARILQRLHALRGERRLVAQAMDLAEGHFDATGDLESLFLAWQCARRCGAAEPAERLARVLTEEHGTSPQGALVAALGSPATTLDELLRLEIRFGGSAGSPPRGVPEELEFAIAYLLLRDGDEQKRVEAIGRLESVIARLPADPDARVALAFALHEHGDRARRDLHLDWLLRNAPADDERRPSWEAMRQQPAVGR